MIGSVVACQEYARQGLTMLSWTFESDIAGLLGLSKASTTATGINVVQDRSASRAAVSLAHCGQPESTRTSDVDKQEGWMLTAAGRAGLCNPYVAESTLSRMWAPVLAVAIV